jgi:hypothetical protein
VGAYHVARVEDPNGIVHEGEVPTSENYVALLWCDYVEGLQARVPNGNVLRTRKKVTCLMCLGAKKPQS